jgi:hypothetical protein|tara:strand:+ start:387 stop:611 length:225 start_codon:yes stop_codon:yes gene_type:complete
MEVAKKYHGMIEKTIYVLEEVVIIAENEIEAEDKLLDRDYEVIGSEIQEESINNEWIDSSEPLSVDEYMEYSRQ